MALAKVKESLKSKGLEHKQQEVVDGYKMAV